MPKDELQKRLLRYLLLSVTLNVSLIVLQLYGVFASPAPYDKQHKNNWLVGHHHGLEKEYNTLKGNSYLQLKSQLRSKRRLGKGLLLRDIALGLLVQNHHFDITRSLQRIPSYKYWSINHSGEKVPIFYGLNDEDMEHIIYFAHSQKYPYTLAGLVLRYQTNSKDYSLKKAILSHDEAMKLRLLLRDAKVELNEHELITCLSSLHTEAEGLIRQKGAIQPLEARSLLSSQLYQRFKSHFSYDILLILEKHFPRELVESLDQEEMKELIKSSKKHDDQFVKYVEKEYYDPSIFKLLQHFKKHKKSKSPRLRKYVIQSGDSLWLIAKKHNTTISKLCELNNISSRSFLSVGKTLFVPALEEDPLLLGAKDHT